MSLQHIKVNYKTRNLLKEAGWDEDNIPKIIAKIENRQGLLNLKVF